MLNRLHVGVRDAHRILGGGTIMMDWQWFLVVLAGVLAVVFTYVRKRKRSNIILMNIPKPVSQVMPAPDKGAPSPGGPAASA